MDDLDAVLQRLCRCDAVQAKRLPSCRHFGVCLLISTVLACGPFVKNVWEEMGEVLEKVAWEGGWLAENRGHALLPWGCWAQNRGLRGLAW